MARIEFYIGDSPKYIASLGDDVAPRAGEYVNIRKVPYLVARVTWAVDYTDSSMSCQLRANVELALIPERKLRKKPATRSLAGDDLNALDGSAMR